MGSKGVISNYSFKRKVIVFLIYFISYTFEHFFKFICFKVDLITFRNKIPNGSLKQDDIIDTWQKFTCYEIRKNVKIFDLNL